MTELRALTSARGAAAWIVVLYHIRGAFTGMPPAVSRVLGKGYLAVDFFFLLSGFVIWLTWHDRLRAGGVAAIPHFLHKRIARIWPLHLTMLAAAAALALSLAATGRSDPAFPAAELPLHLLLVQNWGLTGALSWNDPAWSISCEVAAYLLFPWLAIAIDWRKLPTLALVTAAGGLLFALSWIMRDQPTLGADIPRFGLARCLIEFTTGTIVAALWLRGARGSVAAAALAGTAWYMGAPETLCAPVTFAALLLMLARIAVRPYPPRRHAGHAERVIHYLGEISYATYLSHFLLWKAFKLAFVRPGQIPPTHIAIYLVLVFVASAGLYRYVERPAQRRINAIRFRPVRPRVLPPAR